MRRRIPFPSPSSILRFPSIPSLASFQFISRFCWIYLHSFLNILLIVIKIQTKLIINPNNQLTNQSFCCVMSELAVIAANSVQFVSSFYKAFRHVETLFVQGNIFVLNQNKPPCLVIKKRLTIVNLFFLLPNKEVCFDWFSTKILPWTNKVIHVEMPY